ncbi:hypothetical protein KXD93_25525 [Mucilaginibacter sp. BJC16-A38]|uniref:hypothetical protein n=1 Tax=Mucilaginibacter phenanthrenivorans TaxID=1234842 RepID=UPI002157D518|nr:hypothetical protein [Mucilaginibacter phenanthrenivorans]MCR8561043.1 hypothetical protein [Mucilaginibacter phenanthrenivorans]
MSQNFKLKFDEMRESKPTGETESAQSGIHESFSNPGNVRNLCFVWPDGRMKFLNYAYLISAEYRPNDGTIVMVYTTDTVMMVGSGLRELFLKFLSHLPMKVECADPRYNLTDEHDSCIINDINICSSR